MDPLDIQMARFSMEKHHDEMARLKRNAKILEYLWILFLAIFFTVAIAFALNIGLEKEARRQQLQLAADCATDLGIAINNYARQNNLTPPCAE